jgi:hypothetical protein
MAEIFEKGRETGVWKVDAAGYEWLAAVVRRHDAHGYVGRAQRRQGRLERYKAGARSANGKRELLRPSGWPFLRGLEECFNLIRVFT